MLRVLCVCIPGTTTLLRYWSLLVPGTVYGVPRVQKFDTPSNYFNIFQICQLIFVNGDVAQMVERSLSMRQVVGSMPIISIFFFFERVL